MTKTNERRALAPKSAKDPRCAVLAYARRRNGKEIVLSRVAAKLGMSWERVEAELEVLRDAGILDWARRTDRPYGPDAVLLITDFMFPPKGGAK